MEPFWPSSSPASASTFPPLPPPSASPSTATLPTLPHPPPQPQSHHPYPPPQRSPHISSARLSDARMSSSSNNHNHTHHPHHRAFSFTSHHGDGQGQGHMDGLMHASLEGSYGGGGGGGGGGGMYKREDSYDLGVGMGGAGRDAVGRGGSMTHQGGGGGGGSQQANHSPHQGNGGQQAQLGLGGTGGNTAKRGSKACVACRKGKNRCEPDPSGSSSSCRRCLLNNLPCVFEKASDRVGGRGRTGSISNSAVEGFVGEAEGRVSSLERSVQDLARGQNQIQNALQQLLSLIPSSSPVASSLPFGIPSNGSSSNTAPLQSTTSLFPSPPSIFSDPTHGGQAYPSYPPAAAAPTSPQNTASNRISSLSSSSTTHSRPFPKLPGFAPPAHQFGTYGVIPLSSAPPSPNRSGRGRSSSTSSSHSVASSGAIPQEEMGAPMKALQTLAAAADQARADPSPAKLEEGLERPDARESGGGGGVGADSGYGNGGGAGGAGGMDSEMGGKRKRAVTFGVDDDDQSPGTGAGSKMPGGGGGAAGGSGGGGLRIRKKTKPDPTPRNPFPDVVTKGLVSELEARELWDVFFSGCHYFVPLWDKKYDTYETFIERTPFSTNGLLAIAAKIRAGNGPLGPAFQRCLEEAQGIARSTLFGPIVRKEAVMAMVILSVWSQNGWLPCGHAVRMGMDMNLHRALDRLAESEERSEAEERDLVVSARIWLNCYMHDALVSLGTGKPLMLRDDSSVRRARILLQHHMQSETDVRLVAGVELVNLRVRILDRLSPLHGKLDPPTLSFVRRTFTDLQEWYSEWHALHLQRGYAEGSVLVRLLEAELVHAQLWTVCVALRGRSWDRLDKDQRELAFQGKDAALRCLDIFLRAPDFRAHLKYATHDQLVSGAFAAVFLLKIAILYPMAISLTSLISQISELAHLLSSECYAERYALTLRLMLSNFRRKTGVLSTAVPGTPRQPILSAGASGTLPPNGGGGAIMGELDGGLQSLLSLPDNMGDWGASMAGLGGGELEALAAGAGGFGGNGTGAGDLWSALGETEFGGLEWPTEFSPSNLPVWLQDGNFTDLGLPADGSDSLFLPPELANMFLPNNGSASSNAFQFSLPDSADVGAEAW